jgi:hypothetical protein
MNIEDRLNAINNVYEKPQVFKTVLDNGMLAVG